MGGEFDDLLGDVIAEVPAAPQSEYLTKPAAELPDLEAKFFDKDELARWMVETMTVPFEGINDAVVAQGYASVVWHFRQAALLGDIDRARSLKMWLDWAQPYIRPKQTEDRVTNPGASAFLPREAK